MSNSSLVTVKVPAHASNYTAKRNHAIDKITIHHMAGMLTAAQCGGIFAKAGRGGSSNYGVGFDGSVGMYVPEAGRSWASSSPANDHRAITIEVSNSGGAPDWKVGQTAYNKTIELCVDIVRRNPGIKKIEFTGNATGNLTMHQFFANTACPGPYLKSRFPEIAALVNQKIGAGHVPVPAPSAPASGLIRFGMTGPSVKDVQNKLNAQGFNCGKADSIFGNKTLSAVKAFQKAKGLGVDGIVGPATLGALANGSSSKPSTSGKITLSVDGLWGSNTTRRLQQFLGINVDGINGIGTRKAMQKWLGVAQDGSIGPNTVKALQKKVGASVDGKLGPNTVKALQTFLNKN